MGYISIAGNGILSTEFILSVWLSGDVSLQGVKWIANCQRAWQWTDKHGSSESLRWERFQERGDCLNRYSSSWNWLLPRLSGVCLTFVLWSPKKSTLAVVWAKSGRQVYTCTLCCQCQLHPANLAALFMLHFSMAPDSHNFNWTGWLFFLTLFYLFCFVLWC